MQIFIVHGNHPTVQGDPMQVHATKESANAYAAELVNIFLKEYTDPEDDFETPILSPDATAETWEAKCLEYRQHIADDQGRDLDHLDDEDAGDVWIIEDVLHGAPIIIPVDCHTPWHGGETPPLPAGHAVNVRHRNGKEFSTYVGTGRASNWMHEGSPIDIVAFLPIIEVTGIDPADMKPIIGTKHEG